MADLVAVDFAAGLLLISDFLVIAIFFSPKGLILISFYALPYCNPRAKLSAAPVFFASHRIYCIYKNGVFIRGKAAICAWVKN